ncbi:MAG: leucine-rich repeat domain-containing protein [Raineya sp.]|jgi:Leucine-rich repeat (LRR) protein|nr:leucine-rich repeat domain-containing protein [Raineya sp.]
MKKYILLVLFIIGMDNSFGQTRSIKIALQDSLHYDEWNLLNIDASLDMELLPQIKKFKNLKRLFINKMGEFVPEITQLKNLYQLEIVNSTFETLPSNFGDLENLKELEIDANLKELPASFGKLQQLKRLVLSNNNFKSLPLILTTLTKLENLSLDDNFINIITPNIKYMIGLESLFLPKNQLIEIPKEIAELKNLVVIDLSSNPLKDLPKELALLPKLNSIAALDTFVPKATQIWLEKNTLAPYLGILINKDK